MTTGVLAAAFHLFHVWRIAGTVGKLKHPTEIPPVPDLDADVITEAAQKPASASQDGRSATAHSLDQQINAAKFAAANQAPTTTQSPPRPRGIKLVRCIPPGAAE